MSRKTKKVRPGPGKARRDEGHELPPKPHAEAHIETHAAPEAEAHHVAPRDPDNPGPICPECLHARSRVYRTRRRGPTFVRVRECERCGHHYLCREAVISNRVRRRARNG